MVRTYFDPKTGALRVEFGSGSGPSISVDDSDDTPLYTPRRDTATLFDKGKAMQVGPGITVPDTSKYPTDTKGFYRRGEKRPEEFEYNFEKRDVGNGQMELVAVPVLPEERKQEIASEVSKEGLRLEFDPESGSTFTGIGAPRVEPKAPNPRDDTLSSGWESGLLLVNKQRLGTEYAKARESGDVVKANELAAKIRENEDNLSRVNAAYGDALGRIVNQPDATDPFDYAYKAAKQLGYVTARETVSFAPQLMEGLSDWKTAPLIGTGALLGSLAGPEGTAAGAAVGAKVASWAGLSTVYSGQALADQVLNAQNYTGILDPGGADALPRSDRERAALSGALSAGMDIILGELGGKLTRSLSRTNADTSVLKRVGKRTAEVATAMAVGGSQEALQDWSQQWGGTLDLAPEEIIKDPRRFESLANNFAIGALIPAGVGTAAAVGAGGARLGSSVFKRGNKKETPSEAPAPDAAAISGELEGDYGKNFEEQLGLTPATPKVATTEEQKAILKRMVEKTAKAKEQAAPKAPATETTSAIDDYNEAIRAYAEDIDNRLASRPKTLEEFYKRAEDAGVPLDNVKTTEDIKKVDPFVRAAEATKGYSDIAMSPEAADLKERAIEESMGNPKRSYKVENIARATGIPEDFLHTLPDEDLDAIAEKSKDVISPENKRETVTYYHGGVQDPNSFDGPTWVTPDINYAKAYADKTDGKVYSVKIPKQKATEIGAYDEINDYPQNAEVPKGVGEFKRYDDNPVVTTDAASKIPVPETAPLDTEPLPYSNDVDDNLKGSTSQTSPYYGGTEFKEGAIIYPEPFDTKGLDPRIKGLVDSYNKFMKALLDKFNLPVSGDIVRTLEAFRERASDNTQVPAGEAEGAFYRKTNKIAVALASDELSKDFFDVVRNGLNQDYHNTIVSTMVHEIAHALDYLGSLDTKARETFRRAIPTLRRTLEKTYDKAFVDSLPEDELFAYGAQTYLQTSSDKVARDLRALLHMDMTRENPEVKDPFSRDPENPYMGSLRRAYRKVLDYINQIVNYWRASGSDKVFRDLWSGKYNPTVTSILEHNKRVSDGIVANNTVSLALAEIRNGNKPQKSVLSAALEKIKDIARNRPIEFLDRGAVDTDPYSLGFKSGPTAFVSSLLDIENLAKVDKAAALTAQILTSEEDDIAKYKAAFQDVYDSLRASVGPLVQPVFTLALELRKQGKNLSKDVKADGTMDYVNQRGELVTIPATIVNHLRTLTEAMSFPLKAISENNRATLRQFKNRTGYSDMPTEGSYVGLEKWLEKFQEDLSTNQNTIRRMVQNKQKQVKADTGKDISYEEARTMIENQLPEMRPGVPFSKLDMAIFQNVKDLIGTIVNLEGLLARKDIYVPEIRHGNWAISVKDKDGNQVGQYQFDHHPIKNPTDKQKRAWLKSVENDVIKRYGSTSGLRISAPFEMTYNNIGREIGNVGNLTLDLVASLTAQVANGTLRREPGDPSFEKMDEMERGLNADELKRQVSNYLRRGNYGKHLIKSKHLDGASTDADRVIPQFLNAMAYVASNLKWSDMRNLVRNTYKEESLRGEAKEKYKLLVNYLDNSRELGTSKTERFIRGLSYWQGLWGNVSTGLLQFAPLLNAVPSELADLGLPYHKVLNTVKNTMIATGLTVQDQLSKLLKSNKPLDMKWWFSPEILEKMGSYMGMSGDVLKDFVSDAQNDTEHLVANLLEEGRNITDPGKTKSLRAKGKKIYDIADKTGGYLMAATERVSRIGTYATVYKELSGKPEAIRNALNVLNKEAHFRALRRFNPGMSDVRAIARYTVSNTFANPHRSLKLRFTRGWKGALFAPYINMVTKMYGHQMYKLLGGRGNRGVRNAVAQMAFNTLMFGFKGSTYGAALLLPVVLEMFGDGDTPGDVIERQALFDLLSAFPNSRNDIANFLQEGLPGYLGAGSVSRRLALTPPFMNQLTALMQGGFDPKLSELTGIPGSFVANAINAGNQFYQHRGDAATLISPMLPAGIRNIVRGFDAMQGGYKTTTKGKVIGKNDYTSGEIMQKFLGIQTDKDRRESMRNRMDQMSRSTNETVKRRVKEDVAELLYQYEVTGEYDYKKRALDRLEEGKSELERRGEVMSSQAYKQWVKGIYNDVKRRLDPETEEGLTSSQKESRSTWKELFNR